MKKPKPCKWCKRMPIVSANKRQDGTLYFNAACPDCDNLARGYTAQEAIREWNKQQTEDK